MIDSAIISWLKSAQPSATTSTTHSHFLMDYHTRKQKSIHRFWIDPPTVETERLAIHLAGKTEGYPVTNWLSEFPFRYIFSRIKGYIIFLPISERMWFNSLQLSVFLIISPQIGVNIHKQIWNRHLEKVSTHLKNVRYVRYISQNGNLP